jgi:hypothetical protein
VDCTTHLCHRVHPCQGDWYHSNKHAHFITAQVIALLSWPRCGANFV